MKNKTKEPKLTREEGCVLEVLSNKEQIIQFQKSFGCARFVYNHFLDMRINLYKYTNTSMNYNEMSFVLTNYVKKEFPFLKEVDNRHSSGDHCDKTNLSLYDEEGNNCMETVVGKPLRYYLPFLSSKTKENAIKGVSTIQFLDSA